MIKAPFKRNKSTGNVSLSHKEFSTLKNGTILEIRGVEIMVENWMIASSKDMGKYVLLPYSKHSFLVKKDE